MTHRRAVLIISIGLLLAALAAAAVVSKVRLAQRLTVTRNIDLPILDAAPLFTLTDTENQEFSRASLDDNVWVADFFFSRCNGPCPIMNGNMAKIAARFKGTPGVQFVSISVDPENDTPEVLRDYAARFSADTTVWHFLTGPAETIRRLAAEGFKLGSLESPIVHSTRMVLVDRSGHIRGYYDGTDSNAVERLVKDLRLLLDAKT